MNKSVKGTREFIMVRPDPAPRTEPKIPELPLDRRSGGDRRDRSDRPDRRVGGDRGLLPDRRSGGDRRRGGVRRVAAGSVAIAIMSGPFMPSATAAASPSSTRSRTSGPNVGMVADITWGTSRAKIDRTVASMAGAGVDWVRANLNWSGGEPSAKGVLNESWLRDVDYAIKRARDAGIEILMPIADGVPYWASADPAKYKDASGNHWNKYWRPRSVADYGAFVRAMVKRYAAMGVHTYEVWNEPNVSRFWPSGPNAVQYTALLAAGYKAIKAVDPGATVVLGGLSKSDYDYLAKLYAAGARRYFDVVAVHPYTGSVDPNWCWNEAGRAKLAKDAFCSIAEVRKTMVANGDSAKPIWLTEFGWSTTSGDYGVSEATQAKYMTAALDKLSSSYPYVKNAFWYNFRNDPALGEAPDNYDANLGLLRLDFSAKPAYAALKSWAG